MNMPYKNKEDAKKNNKKWQENNPEKVKENSKKSYQKHKKEKLEYAKQYRLDNPDYYKKQSKIYYQEHKVEKAEYNKKRRLENPEKFRKRKRIWRKEKTKTDPQFKLNHNMSTAIYSALKDKKDGRHWETLVGYSLQELKQHIEKQFDDWMNWDNYGLWHIDHIRPKSLFNYKTAEDPEFKKCWKLSNLQLLEAMENIIKSNNC